MPEPIGLLLVGGLLALGGVLIGKTIARPVVLNLDNSTHEQVFVESENEVEVEYVSAEDDEDEDEDEDEDDGEGWKRGQWYR